MLAILAAQLGAHRIVGVDFGGSLDMARALAHENGVADRIEFVEGDVAQLDGSIGAFDVIVGMVYNNEVWSELAQHQMMGQVVQRFGHQGTKVIPDRVLYTVGGYDSAADDNTGRTARADWDDNIERGGGPHRDQLRRRAPTT